MRQAIFTEPWRVAVHTVDDPRPEKGQVLIEVRACGICTWEQRVFRGVRKDYPLLGGHEIGGVVIETTTKQKVKVGDVVAVSRLPRCNTCFYCEEGLDNLCSYFGPARSNNEPWGPAGFSQYLAVPSEDVFVVSPHVSCEEAALVEPIACCVRSLRRAGLRRGSLIAVFGIGFMGLLHIALAKYYGIRVIAVTDQRSATDIVQAGLVPDLIVTQQTTPDIIQALFRRPGVDASICIRGGMEALQTSMMLTRPGGRIVVFQSFYHGERLDIDPNYIRSRELTILGTVSHTRRNFAEAARVIGEHSLSTLPLITRKFPLSEIASAMHYACTSDRGRVIIDPLT